MISPVHGSSFLSHALLCIPMPSFEETWFSDYDWWWEHFIPLTRHSSVYFDLCILSTGYRSCDCSMALCPCCGCMKQISHRSFPPSDHIVQITNLGSAFQELRSSSFILVFDKCKWYSDTPVLSARSSNVLLVQLSAKNTKDPSKRVQNEFLHEVVDTLWNWSLASGNPHFNTLHTKISPHWQAGYIKHWPMECIRN